MYKLVYLCIKSAPDIVYSIALHIIYIYRYLEAYIYCTQFNRIYIDGKIKSVDEKRTFPLSSRKCNYEVKKLNNTTVHYRDT